MFAARSLPKPTFRLRPARIAQPGRASIIARPPQASQDVFQARCVATYVLIRLSTFHGSQARRSGL